MEYTICTMTNEDYDETVALWQRSDGIGLDLNGADSRDGIAAYLRRNAGLSFVARADEHLVGAVLCGHDGRRGYLHHLAVDHAYRRLGIGSALIAHCRAALHAEGIARCNIFVFTDNTAGQHFWQRHGRKAYPDLLFMQALTTGEDVQPPISHAGQPAMAELRGDACMTR